MIVLYMLAAVLATFRLTELITVDTITEPLRRRCPARLRLPFQCVRCASVWAAGIATALFFYAPWLNVVFALAWLYLVHNDVIIYLRTQRQSEARHLTFLVHPNGGITVGRADFEPAHVKSIVESVYQTVVLGNRGNGHESPAPDRVGQP